MEGVEKTVQAGPPSEMKEARPAHLATEEEHPVKVCICPTAFSFNLTLLCESREMSQIQTPSILFQIYLPKATNTDSYSQTDKLKFPFIQLIPNIDIRTHKNILSLKFAS